MLDQPEFLGEPGHRRLGDDEAVGGEHVAVDLGARPARPARTRRPARRRRASTAPARRGAARDAARAPAPARARRDRLRHGRGRGRGRAQRRAEIVELGGALEQRLGDVLGHVVPHATAPRCQNSTSISTRPAAAERRRRRRRARPAACGGGSARARVDHFADRAEHLQAGDLRRAAAGREGGLQLAGDEGRGDAGAERERSAPRSGRSAGSARRARSARSAARPRGW